MKCLLVKLFLNARKSSNPTKFLVTVGVLSLNIHCKCLRMFAGTEITRIRPIIIEGEAMMVTMDHRLDRLNVEIAGGKVVKVLKTG